MGWGFIFGLLFLSAGTLVNAIEFDRKTLAWIVFRINPRYWSLWPIAVLWGIAAWLACDIFGRFDFICRRLLAARIGIVIIGLCWMAWLCGWTGIAFCRKIYGIYLWYIVGPIALFMGDGQWRWQLLIVPTFGVIIVSLLFIAYQQRKKGKKP